MNSPNSKISSPNDGNVKRLWKTIERTNRYRVDPFGNAINLSKLLFTKYQQKLLNKNLNFCPTPERYNRNEVTNDFKEFKRKIKPKAHFALQENHDINQLNFEKNITPKKSKWELDKNHHTVNTFIEAIDNGIEYLHQSIMALNIYTLKKLHFRNQTWGSREKRALEELANRDDLIFRKVDKGGAAVMPDINSYI